VVRTLAFGGDLLTHMPLVAGAQRYGAATGVPYDFGPMLAPMAPVLGGVDLALCHLEVPLVGDGQQVTGYPSFHAPRELANAIAGAGYDGCSTASNHSLDGGRPAIDATLATFDTLGLGHVGTARSPEEDVAPRLYSLDGVVVAHLSYSYGFNGYEPPADAPWVVDRIDPAVIARDATAARAAGAHLVVVSLHWGTEYQHDPDTFQRDTAAAVTAIGDVDLVIGHHAHVVQPVEQVGGRWVVFGLGNQLSNQDADVKRDGLTVVVTVAGPSGGRMAVRSIEAVPTYVDLDTYEVLPTAATLARPDLDPGLRGQLEASQARTMATVNAAGADILIRP
jgi:poly-gamma-glutamate capsule biosynthesis protein CapA/YwtB (metallophosphatase superfamily)